MLLSPTRPTLFPTDISYLLSWLLLSWTSFACFSMLHNLCHTICIPLCLDFPLNIILSSIDVIHSHWCIVFNWMNSSHLFIHSTWYIWLFQNSAFQHSTTINIYTYPHHTTTIPSHFSVCFMPREELLDHSGCICPALLNEVKLLQSGYTNTQSS